MNYTKTFVCFTNSRKMSGRCIAGKEWHDGQPGAWVRPVSASPYHEISQQERSFQDGSEPQLLDIVEVPCKNHQPLPHQNENHLIAMGRFWSKQGTLAWADIARWCDSPDSLWGTGEQSHAGLNNRIVSGQENGESLVLVAVEQLRLLVGHRNPSKPDSKRGVLGEFGYRGVVYRLDITDPVIEQKYLNRPDGEYDIWNPVLCVSLSDPHWGYFYKLIAAVLYAERCK